MNETGPELEALISTRRVVALVLGGGRGTRLYPLTMERAKPAVPLGGRYRLVDVPISNCLHSDVKRIFVYTQFNSASLNRHIMTTYKFDNFTGGFVEVLAAEQTDESVNWFQGTADAIRQHMKTLRDQRATHYLILSGDHLYRMDYRILLASHLRHQADITVATLPVTRRQTHGFGIMKVEDSGQITQFVEKPETDAQLAELVTPPAVMRQYGCNASDEKEFLASMGVYLFKASVLEEILVNRADWFDFGKQVIPGTLETHRVFSHIFGGYWEDIGTVRSYYETSMALLSPEPPFEFHYLDPPIYTRPRYLPGARLQDVDVTDSIICEGSRIGRAQIRRSIVGIRTIVQRNVTIEESIIMGSDYYRTETEGGGIPMGIGNNSHIVRAIIDKNACIGNDVTICGSDDLRNDQNDNWFIRDGIVIVPKGAQIANGTRIA